MPFAARDIRRAAAFDTQTCLRAVLVGTLAGLLGGIYRHVLDRASPWHEHLIARTSDVPLGWVLLALLFAAGAGLARWLTVTFSPEAAGSGIPQVEDVLAHGGRLGWHRLLPVKFFAGAIALMSGMSLGREGPTVHMGAALGEALDRSLDATQRRALLTAGAGAGLTAAFNAPLAGLVFVLEELAMAPSLLATTSAFPAVLMSYLVVSLLVGSGPMFAIPRVPTPSFELLPLFVVLGLAAGIVGVAFNRGLLWSLAAFESMTRVPTVLRAAAVGALAAVIAWWVPAAIGNGEPAARAIVQGTFVASLGWLAVLLVVKLGLTLLSYASGVPGGIFAPQLVLGATLGAIAAHIVPHLGGGVLAPSLATAGMVGVFAASVRAPATGLVLVLELTHSDQLLVQQATTAVVAYLLAAALRELPIYEALRARTADKLSVMVETFPSERAIDATGGMGNKAPPEDTP